MPKKFTQPLVLIILDGWGYRESNGNNAVSLAKKPNLDALEARYPWTLLDASGEAVGLPRGQMGNSEAGHLNMGAGRIIYQDLTRINLEIERGSFFSNKALTDAIKHATDHQGVLHLLGLVSDGGVHSEERHLYALVKLAKMHEVDRVYIHCFLDGRDTPPRSAAGFLEKLELFLQDIGIGKILSIAGRYYAMDRDSRWDRTELAFKAIVYGEGKSFSDTRHAIEIQHDLGKDDEFVPPLVIEPVLEELANLKERSSNAPLIDPRDSMIFFNFRPDRARQLTAAITSPTFVQFDRGKEYKTPYFTCFTDYSKEFSLPVAFLPEEREPGLAEIISQHNLKQLKVAETEKYAHVTFFFNGGAESPLPGEDRILVPSPKVATYDRKPEMSAYEVMDVVVKAIAEQKYAFILVNFANLDMVGHTGVLKAAVRAVEVVDQCVGAIVEAVLETQGTAVITADHGNAEEMIDETTGQPHTAHGTNLVKFILVKPGLAKSRESLLKSGILADIAPTMLSLMKIEKPAFMTGKNLIKVTQYNKIAR